MEIKNNKLEGMTVAITNMEAMIEFYTKVFDFDFQVQEFDGMKLGMALWSGLRFLFCPAEVAGIDAQQNRHQFDILVTDIKKSAELVKENGGTLLGEIAEDEYSLSIGIQDPDANSLVLKQMK